MTILLLVIFAIIGLGPTLLARRSRLDDAESWLLAPAVGLSIVAILATLLVTLDQPIGIWARWSAGGLCGISAAMAIWTWRRQETPSAQRDPHAAERVSRNLSNRNWGFAAVCLGSILVTTPVQMGGRWFNHLRGNAWDAYGYATMADALTHDKFSFLSTASVPALVARHSTYGELREDLKTRWTNGAVLGWAGCVTGTAIFDLEPAWYAVHLLMAIGPAFLLARRAGAGRRWAFIAAVLLGAGFWAGFILDMEAMGQIQSLVILLMLMASWPSVAADRKAWQGKTFLADRILSAVGLCALALVYAEIVPMTVLGLALAMLLAWRSGQASGPVAMLEAIPVIAGLVLAPLLAPVLVAFITHQSKLVTATNDTSNWLGTQHQWLAINPLPGFWGLTHLDAGLSGWWGPLLGLLCMLLACMMTTLLIWQLVGIAVSRNSTIGDRLLAGMIVAGFLQAAALLGMKQYWAAAKGVGYIAPLCLLAVITWWGGAARQLANLKSLRAILYTSLCALVLSQGWSSLLRIVLVARGSDYLSYINHVPYYRAVDFDLSAIRSEMAISPRMRLGLMIDNPWLARMVRMELGWEMRVVEPLGIQDVITGQVTPTPRETGPVDYWLWSNTALPPNSPVMASTSALTLTRALPFIIDSSHYAMEPDAATGGRMFWLGGATTLRVNVPETGRAFLIARFEMGPSLPESNIRNLKISTDASTKTEEVQVNAQTTEIGFPVKAGINIVRLECTDEPSRRQMPNGDLRELMLRVVNPQLRFAPSFTTP